jgi:hypothetical protein
MTRQHNETTQQKDKTSPKNKTSHTHKTRKDKKDKARSDHNKKRQVPFSVARLSSSRIALPERQKTRNKHKTRQKQHQDKTRRYKTRQDKAGHSLGLGELFSLSLFLQSSKHGLTGKTRMKDKIRRRQHKGPDKDKHKHT